LVSQLQTLAIHINARIIGRFIYTLGDFTIKINNDNAKVCYFSNVNDRKNSFKPLRRPRQFDHFHLRCVSLVIQELIVKKEKLPFQIVVGRGRK
jgi:hypothetical protein